MVQMNTDVRGEPLHSWDLSRSDGLLNIKCIAKLKCCYNAINMKPWTTLKAFGIDIYRIVVSSATFPTVRSQVISTAFSACASINCL